MTPGQIVGGYELVSPIARGGMGVIWKARHPSLERWVAIKHIRGDVGGDEGIRRAFVQEVKNLSRLHSPQIVHIIDHGFTDLGEPYMVTEFLEGEDLGQRLEREISLPVKTTLRIGIEVLKALSEAHAIGLVHRDLKPGNIFLQRLAGENREAIKVLDFGVAKLLSDGFSPTIDPSMGAKGSARFMAPEQVLQNPITTAADMYSFGATLYRMLTGTYVFGGTPVEVLKQHLTHQPQPLRQRNPDTGCSADLEDLVMVCLQKKPEDRPSSADALLSRMERMLTHSSEHESLSGIASNLGSISDADDDEGLPSWLESASGIRGLHESTNQISSEFDSPPSADEHSSAFSDDPFAEIDGGLGPMPTLPDPMDHEGLHRIERHDFDASKTVEEAQPVQMLAALRSDPIPSIDTENRAQDATSQSSSSNTMVDEAPVFLDDARSPPTDKVSVLLARLNTPSARWTGAVIAVLVLFYVLMPNSSEDSDPAGVVVEEAEPPTDGEDGETDSDWIERQTRQFEAEDRAREERKRRREQQIEQKRKQAPERVQVKVTHGAADFIRVIDGKVLCRKQVFCLLKIDQAVRVERSGFRPRVFNKAELRSFRGTKRTIRLQPQ